MSDESDDDEGVRALVLRDAIKRDVVFFYHQQAEYDFIADDLLLPSTPWWEYLADEELETDDRDEHIERGVLALTFAAACGEARQVSGSMTPWRAPCREALVTYSPASGELVRLRELALKVLTLTPDCMDRRLDHELYCDGEWIHSVTVQHYYRSMHERFRSTTAVRGPRPT